MPLKFFLFIFGLLPLSYNYAQLPAPADYKLLADQVYTTAGEWEGKMDIYLPENVLGPRPLMIFIHGGGWVHGSKEKEKEFASFFDDKYAVANIEYRLADVAPAPAAIEDCRCALFYLIKNAGKLNLDIKRIGVMGISAGGHLALMTGLLGKDHRFDQHCNATDSFNISLIIDKQGPADLNRWENVRKPNKASSAWLGGRGEDTVFINTVSPISYVSKNAPATLIIHGDKDNTVPMQQSQTLYDKMRTSDAIVEFQVIPGATHSITKPEDKEIVRQRIIDFTRKHL